VNTDEDMWRAAVQHLEAYSIACQTLRRDALDLVALARRGLHGSRLEVTAALDLLGGMPEAQRIELFEDLLPMCLRQACAQRVRGLIAALPRPWVLAKIERLVNPVSLAQTLWIIACCWSFTGSLTEASPRSWRNGLSRPTILIFPRRVGTSFEAGRDFLEELGCSKE